MGQKVRVVLDTNVFVSGVFFTGPPYRIHSPPILEEYKRVGETLASQFPDIDLERFFYLLMLNAEVVPSQRLAEPVCTDPDDDKFLACALTSGAKYVISGDKHLLDASGYKGLEVISPRRFVDHYL